MTHLFFQTKHRSKLSGGLIEAMWETLIALSIAAAICTGIVSLSAHLNESRTARASVTMAHAAATATPSGLMKAPASVN